MLKLVSGSNGDIHKYEDLGHILIRQAEVPERTQYYGAAKNTGLFLSPFSVPIQQNRT